MFYRPGTSPDPSSIVINDQGLVDGQQLQQDIKHLVKLIVNDEKKKKAPLKSESFVIAIQGSWGTGKTWASWAFINHLKTQAKYKDETKFHIFSFELLPFGNINESVGNILGSIAGELWDKGVVDVRKELKQMTVDATPTQEVNAGISLFGVSLSRKLTLSGRYKQNKRTLREKFIKISEDGHRLLVMLDDLDRMKPDEVVVVTRMVENFKDIPGIIFVLPFYRDAVATSIHESLMLSEASSHVFLRKFIKASITIELNVENLKQSFIRDFTYGSTANANTAVHNHFDMNTSEVAWYILLHILLIRESISAMGTDPTGNSVAANFNNNEASNYLFRLPQVLGQARNPQNRPEISTLPYLTDNKWKRFADVYGSLSDPTSNVPATIGQLKSLLNEDMLVGYIYTDTALVEELRQRGEVDYDATRDQTMAKKSVFETLVLPNIKESSNEPLLTTSYSRRDMEQLSKAICNDPDFKIVEDPEEFIKNLVAVIRKRFLEFR